MTRHYFARANRHQHQDPLLDAADEIFVRRGIGTARMQEIADHPGVNTALLQVRSATERIDAARAGAVLTE